MSTGKNIYFVSDLHLGVPNEQESIQREKRFVQWLSDMQPNMQELFLVGDIFDFWFDYGKVVPKGFVRILGKLAELTDKGIPIHYFKGNHDMWLDGYFEKELGVTVYDDSLCTDRFGKKIFIAHGDGKGPGDKGYKRLKKIFRNPVCQWLFRWLHPDIGMALAQYWSNKSRYGSGEASKEVFLGEEKEWLVAYVKKKMSEEKADYYVFGHRHLPLEISIPPDSVYINLGDWIDYNTYAELNEEGIQLKSYQSQSNDPEV